MQKSSVYIAGQKNNSFGHMITDGRMVNRQAPLVGEWLDTDNMSCLWTPDQNRSQHQVGRSHTLRPEVCQRLKKDQGGLSHPTKTKTISDQNQELRSHSIYNHLKSKVPHSGHVICDKKALKYRWKFWKNNFQKQLNSSQSSRLGNGTVNKFLNHIKPFPEAVNFWWVFNFFCVFCIISGEKSVFKYAAHKSIIMYSATSTTVNLPHTLLLLLLVSYYLETQLQKDVKCIKDKEAQVENKRWSGKQRRSWGKSKEGIHKHNTHTHTRNIVLRLSLLTVALLIYFRVSRVQTSWKRAFKDNLLNLIADTSDLISIELY